MPTIARLFLIPIASILLANALFTHNTDSILGYLGITIFAYVFYDVLDRS